MIGESGQRGYGEAEVGGRGTDAQSQAPPRQHAASWEKGKTPVPTQTSSADPQPGLSFGRSLPRSPKPRGQKP